MATFNELVAQVLTIINRPEMTAEAEIAVKAATLQLHRKDYFYKDLFEVTIQFDPVGYLQTIEYQTIIPLFRSLKYLRKYDGSEVGAFIDVIMPEQVLDSYKLPRADVCYVAGNVIQIRSSTDLTYALLGCYLNPNVASAATYNSWIAVEAPYAIIYTAVANMYGTILGDTTRQQAAIQQAQQEFAEVLTNNIIAIGY